MEIQQSQERHQQSMGLIESLRKELPRIVSAAERQLGKGKGPEGEAVKPRRPQPQGKKQPVEMPLVECPHCGIQFGVPSNLENVLCPNPNCPSNQAVAGTGEQPPKSPSPEEEKRL